MDRGATEEPAAPDGGPRRGDRRSRRTRQQLSEALVALLLEKRYDTITVQEIIDRADVGRSTFYAHFLDKDDLLLQEITGLVATMSIHTERREGRSRVIPSLELLRHVGEQQRLYRALVRGRIFDPVLMMIQISLGRHVEARLAALMPPGQVPAVPLALVGQHMAGALLTLLQWWLEQDAPDSPEQINAHFEYLVRPGVLAATGVEI